MEQLTAIETENRVDVWNLLSPEQRIKAGLAAEALVNKFKLDSQDVGIVMVESAAGEPKPVVMYTAAEGIYRGSWEQVVSKKANKDFMVKVGRQKVDTRQAMTFAVYDAFVEDAKSKGATPLPDSHTLTLLTGHNSGNFVMLIPTGVVADGLRGDEATYYRIFKDDAGPAVCFRPAVVIE